MTVDEGDVPAGDTRFGGRFDTAKVTQTDGLIVDRQIVSIGDPETLGNVLSVTPGGQMAVSQEGVQSTNNTTTTPLAGDATFTGTGEQNAAPDVMVSCQSDVSGTLYFDFSVDGTNWGAFPSAGFSVSAGIHEFHTAVKGPRYFRLRFVNGSSAQSYLRLYTYFGTFRQGNAPLNQSLGVDADATVVRSYPDRVDLALGRLGGVQEGDKFGYAAGLGTSIQLGTPATWVDLWAYGGQRTAPTSSFTPFMASDSAADTDIDITWTYQDADGVENTVTVATDGSDGRTPVSLGVTATEVYRGKNDDSTDLAGNVAVTTANNYTNGAPDNQNEVLAYIPVNEGQTQVLALRVPAGKGFVLQGLELAVARASGAAGSVDLVFQIREAGKVWRTIRPFQITTSPPPTYPFFGRVLDVGTDIRVRIRDVSDNGTSVSGTLDYLSIDV